MRIQLKELEFFELSKALNVTPKAISERLYTVGKIHKQGIWLPYKWLKNAILNRLSIATSLLVRQKKVFCGIS